MKLRLLLAVSSALLINTAWAQQLQRCSTMEAFELQKKNDPGLEQRMNALTEEVSRIAANRAVSDSDTIVIPVVFHVVWNTTAEKLSKARLQTQIQVLNEDFLKMSGTNGHNTHPAGTNCRIRFALAVRDPQNNATEGITYTNTTVASFSTNNDVKFASKGGKDAWPRDKYLNYWVCDLGASLLGYAQFPGGAANTDGVVCHYKYTGTTGASAPYHLGRTATHEIGHWLGLFHIWGDDGSACTGSDQVNDTPNQASEHYGCPSTPQISCSNGPDGDMYQNYMDYTDDACMNIFTKGQFARMRAVLDGSRAPIKTSNALTPVTVYATNSAISEIITPSATTYCDTVITPQVKITNFGSNSLTSLQIKYKLDNISEVTKSWSGNLATSQAETVVLDPIMVSAGSRKFTVYCTMPNGTNDEYKGNDTLTFTFTNKAKPVSVFTSDKDTANLATETGKITFTNTSVGTSWAWDFGDGGSSTLKSPSHTYAAVGTYSVRLIAKAASCVSDTSYKTITIIDQLDGVKSANGKKDFSVYPNPTKGIIKVKTDPSAVSGNYRISVLNVIGVEVAKMKVTEEQTQIDLSKCPEGLYFVKIYNEKESSITKISVNK